MRFLALEAQYRRLNCRRKPRLLPQRIRSVNVFNVAMQRFTAKLAPHVAVLAPIVFLRRPPGD